MFGIGIACHMPVIILSNDGNRGLEHLLQEWNGKEIVFPKNPSFTVSFKADRPEHFNKNIIIHSNTDDSPYVLCMKGHAKK